MNLTSWKIRLSASREGPWLVYNTVVSRGEFNIIQSRLEGSGVTEASIPGAREEWDRGVCVRSPWITELAASTLTLIKKKERKKQKNTQQGSWAIKLNGLSNPSEDTSHRPDPYSPHLKLLTVLRKTLLGQTFPLLWAFMGLSS